MLISAYGVTENTPPESSLNLGYEVSPRVGDGSGDFALTQFMTQVAYWRYGLDIAQIWKRRLGQPVPEMWSTVAENTAPPPSLMMVYTLSTRD